MKSEIEPIHNQIVFQFLEDTMHGHFNEKTSGGILLVQDTAKQVDYARWALVKAVGPEVSDIKEDDVILINNLRWTNAFKITTIDYWITAENEVIAKWDDPSNLPREVA